MITSAKIYEAITELLRKGEQCALVTITDASGSTPRGVGTRMIVKKDLEIIGTIGGGIIEAEAITLASQAMKSGEIIKKKFDLSKEQSSGYDLICGGQLTILIEPMIPPEKLIICGGGHVGQALAKIADMLNFQIWIIDDREEFSNKELFPMAYKTLSADKWENAFKDVPIDDKTYIVIITRFHQGDEVCLRLALRTKARYIGMIGSKTKVKIIKEKLIEEGFPKENVENVHSPIGLKIGGSSPEEIAISIAAELIQTRYNTKL